MQRLGLSGLTYGRQNIRLVKRKFSGNLKILGDHSAYEAIVLSERKKVLYFTATWWYVVYMYFYGIL
jgi:hypothetical protein